MKFDITTARFGQNKVSENYKMKCTEPVKPGAVHKELDLSGHKTCVTQTESFTCNQCTGSFEDRDELFQHIKLAHQQHMHVQSRRRFGCNQCRRTFKSMSGLRNHSRTHYEYFATGAELLNSDFTVSTNMSNISTISTNDDDKYLSTKSNPATERQYDGRRLEEKDNLISKDSKDNNNSSDSSEPSPTNNIVNGVRCKRRRSGIPVPVRKSLLLDKDIHKEHTSDVSKKSRFSSTYDINTESTVIDGALRKELTEESKLSVAVNLEVKNVTSISAKTKCTIDSPSTPRVVVLSTPKQKCRSRSRTPKNRKRIPNDMAVTKTCGRITPNGLNLTPHKTTQSPLNGKRTPGSFKKDTCISNVYSCKKCGKSFVDKSKLEVHFIVHVRETPEKCGISKHSLKKTPIHKTINFLDADQGLGNITHFSCRQCSRAFDKKCHLNAHMKTHDNDVTYNCDNCDKKFRYLSSLKAHSFVHIGESNDRNSSLMPTFPNHCSLESGGTTESSTRLNIFSIPQTVNNQDVNSSDDMDIPFACKMCDYKTRAPAELLIHLTSHSKSGSYKCMHCYKTYKLQKNLKTHEKVHTIHRLKQFLLDKTISSLDSK